MLAARLFDSPFNSQSLLLCTAEPWLSKLEYLHQALTLMMKLGKDGRPSVGVAGRGS